MSNYWRDKWSIEVAREHPTVLSISMNDRHRLQMLTVPKRDTHTPAARSSEQQQGHGARRLRTGVLVLAVPPIAQVPPPERADEAY